MKAIFHRCLVRLACGGAAVCVAAGRLHACGPNLPEQILTSRQVILRTPVGEFIREVAALTEADGAPALPPGFVRVERHGPFGENDFTFDTFPGQRQAVREGAELREVLTARGVPAGTCDQIVTAYQAYRASADFTCADTGGVDTSGDDGDLLGSFDQRARALRRKPPASVPPGPVLPAVLAAGLPGEWVDYLEGAYRFWHGDLAGACAAWERLLARPPTERLYCSVRAAYMLARVQDVRGTDQLNLESARRYERVRRLRADGCHDLLNLAPETFGWQAEATDDLPTAVRLAYLWAVTSDGNSPDSLRDCLRWMASSALGGEDEADPETMAASARDPFLRRVVTLYIACHRYFGDEPLHLVGAPAPAAAALPAPDPANGRRDHLRTERLWLAALSRERVGSVREAAAIAWAAYEDADFAPAAAWLEKAPADDSLALWLRAKLALRDGRTDVAARCFARALRAYPAGVRAVSNEMVPECFDLVADPTTFRTAQFQADLGIVSLARNDYQQALTALLRSGFWNDAAYVAERLLTTRELLAYVRARFPHAPGVNPHPPDPEETWDFSGCSSPLAAIQRQLWSGLSDNPAVYSLRYLLARRLAREGRSAEAREFYPGVLRPWLDALVAARKLGDDPGQSRERRADALWRAGKITRWLGMELFGSEDDPDWRVYNGEYTYESDSYRQERQVHPPDRRDDWGDGQPLALPPQMPPVTREEARRAGKDQLHPEQRFHYRFLAADLAWRAAALLPDEQEQTARVLAAGGWWVKQQDETPAEDRFYYALLRRCGRTDLGRKAAEARGLPDVPHEDPSL